MADNQYIFAVARTRVLETKLLSDSFIEQLITAPDTEYCERLLTEKGWESDLVLEEQKVWDTVKELQVPETVFEVLQLPNLYHNLKAAIKESVTPDPHPGAFYETASIGREKMLKILQTKDFSALPDHMRAVAKEAYDTFLRTQDGQLCDVMVDRACLEAIREEGIRSGSPVIRDYAQTTVEVTDIKIAARAAASGKSPEFALKAMAECSGLNVKELAREVQGGLNGIIGYLRESAFSEAAEALEKSPSAFERWCDNRLIRSMKPQKMNPFSVGPLFAYVIARLNEIKTVRIVLSCKANGFSQDNIRERVREMYG